MSTLLVNSQKLFQLGGQLSNIPNINKIFLVGQPALSVDSKKHIPTSHVC